MKDEQTAGRGGLGELHKRRTTLEDGRYLIYYTFGDESRTSQVTDEEASKRAPDSVAEPSAEEERHV